MIRKIIEKLTTHSILIFVSLLSIFPFIWLISTSLKGNSENIFAYPPQIIPKDFTFANYIGVWDKVDFIGYFINSMIVAGGTVILNLILSAMAGYPLAKSNLELTKYNTDYFKFDLKMDVREAYINLVAAKSILHSLEQQQKLLEELLAIAKKRVSAGAAPEIDVIQAEIALNQMITQVNTAKVNVKSATFEFNKVINPKNQTDTQFDTADELFNDKENFLQLLTPQPKEELPSFDTISENSLKNRFDIKIAKQQIDIAQKNLVTVTRKRIPDLAILGGYGYQSRGMSDDGRFQSGGYIGGSLVNIPLLYTYRPEIKNAKLEIEKAELNYESVQNKAIKDLNSAYEKFVTAKLNLNYYNDKLLKESEEMIKISKLSYQAGKSNLTSLIVMEQSYKSIIVGYTYALAEYYNCWIDFLREVNAEEFNVENESI